MDCPSCGQPLARGAKLCECGYAVGSALHRKPETQSSPPSVPTTPMPESPGSHGAVVGEQENLKHICTHCGRPAFTQGEVSNLGLLRRLTCRLCGGKSGLSAQSQLWHLATNMGPLIALIILLLPF